MKKKAKKRWHWVLLSFLILMGVVGANAEVLLTQYALWFRVDTAEVGADAVVILGPAKFERVRHAHELILQGYAGQILVTDLPPLPWEFVYLQRSDVRWVQAVGKRMDSDAPVILVRNYDFGVLSTWDEAWDLRRYALEHSLRRLIIVTNAFHTRRSLYAFEKVFGGTNIDVQVSAAPNEANGRWDESSWWRTENGLQAYITEPYKFLFYFFTDRNLSFLVND